MPIIETSFGKITDDFFNILKNSQNGDLKELPLIANLSTKRITVSISSKISSYELEMFIRMFSENTFRVKGFIETIDNGLVLSDCVGNVVSVKKTDIKVAKEKVGILNILSGAKTPIHKAVQNACE